MSCHSYDTDCPRCGTKNSIMASTSTRPIDSVNGECLACGLAYYTKMYEMNKIELNEIRKCYEYKGKKIKKLTKNMKDFNLNYNIKVIE